MLSGCYAVETKQGEVQFKSVEPQLLQTGEVRFIPDSSKKWYPLDGPLLFKADQYGTYSGAIIRYVLPGRSELVAEPAILLWRYSMNATLSLNGDIVSEAGQMHPPSRNLHLPQLARLHGAALNETQNLLEVEISVVPGYGYLLPPAYGEFAQLKDLYEQRYFNQIVLNQIIFGFSVFLGLLGFLLWSFDTRNRTYLYFALASLVWSVYSINPFIQDIPGSTHNWLWILHTSIDLFALFLVLFVHRHFELSRIRLEQILILYVCIASAIYAFVPMVNFARLSTVVHLGALLSLAYCFVTTTHLAIRQDRKDAIPYVISIGLFIGLGVHDALLNTGGIETLWLNSFFMLNLGAPVLLLAALTQLMWQLRRTNIHRERSLRKATTELEESYSAQRGLEHQQAANEERARIYRDLHDDVGAKLLDLVYLAKDDGYAQIARDALGDIRSMVSMQNHPSLSLSDWCTQAKMQTEVRLEKYPTELIWGITDDAAMLSGEQQYHLTRCLRELVTNVLKHAKASVLTISVSVIEHDLLIQVADDGLGTAPSRSGGSGLQGIQRRVAELGGTVQFPDSARNGFVVELSLPLTTTVDP